MADALSGRAAGARVGLPVGCASAARVSRKRTGVPGVTRRLTKSASQLVSRTHPAEVAYPIVSGDFVPWMP
jgi:hypothetical protein